MTRKRACEQLQNFWEHDQASTRLNFARANRAKVKFCEQLKTLMDHSSLLNRKEERGKRKEERGKRNEERGTRKEERGKRKKVLSGSKHGFVF